MNGSGSSAVAIIDQYRNAIGRPHGHRHTWLIGHERIPTAVKPIPSGQGSIQHQCIRAVDLFDGQQPAPSARASCRHRDTDIQGFVVNRLLRDRDASLLQRINALPKPPAIEGVLDVQVDTQDNVWAVVWGASLARFGHDQVVAQVVESMLVNFVRAEQRTWVRVVVDGAEAFAGLMPPGTSKEFNGQTLVELATGNGQGGEESDRGVRPSEAPRIRPECQGLQCPVLRFAHDQRAHAEQNPQRAEVAQAGRGRHAG